MRQSLLALTGKEIAVRSDAVSPTISATGTAWHVKMSNLKGSVAALEFRLNCQNVNWFLVSKAVYT
jgi:hypothetical protein